MRISGSQTLIVTLVVGLATPNAALPATADPLLRSNELKIQQVYQSASPAIVRIVRMSGPRETRLFGSGVIVTPDGHVLTRDIIARDNPKGSTLAVYLSDGRRVKATALGWSGEWSIGVLKISDDGPWPHAPLGNESASIRAGQYCVALGYLVYGYSGRSDPSPTMRFGCITESAGQIWATSSCRLRIGDFGAGLFDLEGRLVGVCAQIPTSHDALYTVVDVIRKHWDDLVAGKNLDELRLTQRDDRSSGDARDASRERRAASGPEAATSGLERATAATVRILPNTLRGRENKNWGWSGVIITPDGYIATCAHHQRLPGAEVTVHLPDGRSVPGRVLGMNRLTDVGLVKIGGDGRWPYAEMGNSTLMSNNDPCIIMGYPLSYRENQPLIRRTHVVPNPTGGGVALSSRISTNRIASCQMRGGDSGGGLFDDQGRLIGVHKTVFPYHDHVRVEWFRRQWEFLVAAERVDEISSEPLTTLAQSFSRAAEDNVASAVVEVLRDNEPQALGIIVGTDGRILTKASELYGEIACRLTDGRIFPATVEKVDREHDLGLIRVDADELPVAKWSQSEPITIGALVAAILPSQEPHVGIISQSARAISAEEGTIGAVRDSDRGLKIHDDRHIRNFDLPLQKNDLILRVEGHPTPDHKTYLQLMKPDEGASLANPGDPVRVTIRRGNETLEFQFPLPPPSWPRPPNESRRYSGFSSVFDTDLPLLTTQCGAPLVDATGRVTAIAIACRGRGRVHVIPAAIARSFISD